MRFLILCLIPLCVAAAPKVVKTVPENGKQDVDPETPELRVVFDQPMRPGRSLVNSSRGVFPELVDQPRWEGNNKTFVWKMKLEPNTDYWLSVNGTRFTNFRSANGEPAVPYPIAFSTRGSNKPALPEQIKANKEAIAKLKKIILEDYSYFDLRKVDWEKLFKDFTPQLEAAAGPAEFATTAAKMLGAAQDTHLSMRAGERRIFTHRRDVFPAINFELLKGAVPRWTKRHDWVYSGVFENGTRYLCITSLPGQDAAFLLAVHEVIGEAVEAGKPLIMDLRPNGGGDEITARKIAGCFLDKPMVYAAHVMRSGGKFSEQQQRFVHPNPAGPKFRGRAIVLAGPGTLSSCEAFVLMMKQVPGCIVVGQKTGGSSGNPKIFDLGNGTSVSVPQWKAMRPDGTVFEAEGVAPDVEVQAKPADFEREDPILAEGQKRAAG
ncbi:MAG TPA: S41 family peptidase [Tepidisphaeraceae bacterium]|jgi:hypothetical protein|nr:S41 family peptidase [Tepidisphaeraceae bacterium]